MVHVELLRATLSMTYGLRVHRIQLLGGGADPAASTFRADTATGPVVAKVQTPAAADRAAAVAAALSDLHEPGLLTPLAARDGRRHVELDDTRSMVVWPLRLGRNGFEQHQPPAVLAELGRLIRRVHDLDPVGLPIPIDDGDPRWRDAVLALLNSPPEPADPVLERLRHLVTRHGKRLRRLAEAAQGLAEGARASRSRVLCHGDLHAGNVLIGPDRSGTVLDWDTAVTAPRERDLMFPGAGVGQTWATAEHVAAFRSGYGPYAIDEALIAYYRCDRICEDAAIYAEAVLDPEAAGRMQDMATLESQFQPGDVVDRAERSLDAL